MKEILKAKKYLNFINNLCFLSILNIFVVVPLYLIWLGWDTKFLLTSIFFFILLFFFRKVLKQVVKELEEEQITK